MRIKVVGHGDLKVAHECQKFQICTKAARLAEYIRSDRTSRTHVVPKGVVRLSVLINYCNFSLSTLCATISIAFKI